MHGSARSLALALAVLALAYARAHIPSHDNILRIQLWDAEGLSRDPITTPAPATTPGSRTTRRHKLKVNLDSLYDAMLEEGHDGGFGRFTRHKVRHKRRRPRQTGTDLPWRFHAGDKVLNVAVYDDNVPWDVIEADNSGTMVNTSAVSESASSPVNAPRDVGPPMLLRQPEDEVMSESKHRIH
ncbi:hypothetical protein HF086_004996 [Spodoptera exigua]|uniref:Uncharacterized protein n=1 Tax=Spodoptera exigua TaxID=7107 RepID=A0A922M2L0_SPOEX|nr:hypothetical protein HF086_004996 [Spodoptera exigua]